MCYEKKIEIYVIKANILTPLASKPSTISNTTLSDHIVIIDNEVWIKNWDNNPTEFYSKALYSAEFVRLNKEIFDKIG